MNTLAHCCVYITDSCTLCASFIFCTHLPRSLSGILYTTLMVGTARLSPGMPCSKNRYTLGPSWLSYECKAKHKTLELKFGLSVRGGSVQPVLVITCHEERYTLGPSLIFWRGSWVPHDDVIVYGLWSLCSPMLGKDRGNPVKLQEVRERASRKGFASWSNVKKTQLKQYW